MTGWLHGRVVAAAQVAWLVLAAANVLAGRFGRVVATLEVVLLAALVWRSHVRVTRVLDPGPTGSGAAGGSAVAAGGEPGRATGGGLGEAARGDGPTAPGDGGRTPDAPRNVFADDPVVRGSVTLSALAYAAVLVASGLLAPWTPPPGALATPRAVPVAVLAVYAVSAAAVGGYLRLRYPAVGGVFERVSRRLLGVAPAAVREREAAQLREALRGDCGPATRVVVTASFVLAVGAAVAVVAFVFGVPVGLLASHRPLVVAAVAGWLLYDVGRWAVATGRRPAPASAGGRRPTLADLGDRIGRPARALVGLELDDAGLRGLFAVTYLVAGGLVVTVLLAGNALAALMSGPPTAGRPGAASGALPAWLVAGGAWASAVAASLLLAGYSFLVWYALLRRLPTWVGGRRYGTGRVVALPGPVDWAYPLALVAYFLPARPVATAGPGVVGAGVVRFVGLAVGLAALLVAGVRTTRRVRLPADRVARDGYRVLGYSLLAVGVPSLAARPRAWPAISVLLAGVAMVYFVPRVLACARLVGGTVASLVVVDGYLLVAATVVLLPAGRLAPALPPAVPVVGALGVVLVLGALLDHWLL